MLVVAGAGMGNEVRCAGRRHVDRPGQPLAGRVRPLVDAGAGVAEGELLQNLLLLRPRRPLVAHGDVFVAGLALAGRSTGRLGLLDLAGAQLGLVAVGILLGVERFEDAGGRAVAGVAAVAGPLGRGIAATGRRFHILFAFGHGVLLLAVEKTVEMHNVSDICLHSSFT